MATNPVIWFEIYVQDMERAKKFYEAVLQTKLEKLNNPELEMWAFPSASTRHRSLWCFGQNAGCSFRRKQHFGLFQLRRLRHRGRSRRESRRPHPARKILHWPVRLHRVSH